jgi:hypothetical protein
VGGHKAQGKNKMAELHPLVAFYAGDTFEIEGFLKDAAGRPIDLSAVQSIEWKFATATGRIVVLTYTLGNGVTIVNAIGGHIRIKVSTADSQNLVPGRYRDQVRIVTASSIKSTQWVGFIDVKPAL